MKFHENMAQSRVNEAIKYGLASQQANRNRPDRQNRFSILKTNIAKFRKHLPKRTPVPTVKRQVKLANK